VQDMCAIIYIFGYRECRENGRSDCRTIMSLRAFHSYCSIWMEFGTRDLHVTLMCVREIKVTQSITGPTCPEGSRKLSFPDYMTTAQDGGKVVSLTHRPLLPPGNTRKDYVSGKFQRHHLESN